VSTATASIAIPRTPLANALRTIGLAGLGFVTVIVALADVVARAPAGQKKVADALVQPNATFLFGTDNLGRDVLSETIHALAVTFTAAALAGAIIVVAGACAGFVAARAPLRIGALLRLVSGVLGTLPVSLLAVAIAVLAGRNVAILAAGLAAVPSAFNRSYDRAMFLAGSRHAEFARATGIPASTLLRRDLVYELQGNFLNVAARALARGAIVFSTISFFGFGAVAPHRDLGVMIVDAYGFYLTHWWPATFPALILLLFILFARLTAGLGESEPP